MAPTKDIDTQPFLLGGWYNSLSKLHRAISLHEMLNLDCLVVKPYVVTHFETYSLFVSSTCPYALLLACSHKREWWTTPNI